MLQPTNKVEESTWKQVCIHVEGRKLDPPSPLSDLVSIPSSCNSPPKVNVPGMASSGHCTPGPYVSKTSRKTQKEYLGTQALYSSCVVAK